MDGLSVVALATAALLVRIGQMIGAIGAARAKNAASGAFRSLADLVFATLAFWAIGAAILFQTSNPVMALDPRQVIGWSRISGSWFPMLVVVLIATGTIAPVLAERARLVVPLTLGAVSAGLLVPIIGFLSWRGWLANLGLIDSGGATAIHLVPALVALVGAAMVGPRDNKYNRDGSSNMIPGHSVPLMLTSAMLMLAGWTAYLMLLAPAAPGGQVAANTLIAASAGGAASLLVARFRFGKADVLITTSGILAGLVSITAGAAHVGTPGAFVIGAIGGVIVPWLMSLIDMRLRIDDPAGAIAIHGGGAVWSLLGTALLNPGSGSHFAYPLGIALLTIAIATVTTVAVSSTTMIILRAVVRVRATEADEYDGLDLAEHDINAHPDFQQTMIKSYHLREA